MSDDNGKEHHNALYFKAAKYFETIGDSVKKKRNSIRGVGGMGSKIELYVFVG